MKHGLRKLLIFFSVVLVVFFIIRYLHIADYFSLKVLQDQGEDLKSTVNQNYPLAVFLFFLITMLTVAFSIPVVPVLTIGAGMLFGALRGALFANTAAVLGGLLAYFFIRHTLGVTVRHRYSGRIKQFQLRMQKYGASYLLVLHFMTVIPYVVINVLAAMTDVPVFTFIWTSFIGFIPGSLIYAFAGDQLATITSVSDLFSWKIVLALGLLIMLALVPAIIKRFRKDVVV